MGNQKSILIADDDIVTLDIAHVLLSPLYHVDLAKDGDEAMSLIMNNKYDCLLTDLQMPKKDGFELIKAVQKMKLSIPIIVITKFKEHPNILKSWKLGAFDFIEKPLDRELLLQTVRLAMALGENFIKNTSLSKTSLGRRMLSSDIIFDEDRVLKLMDNNYTDTLGVLKSYIKFIKVNFSDLTKAFELNDPQKIKNTFHKITGSSSNIFCLKVISACENIESNYIDGGEVTEADLDYLEKIIDKTIVVIHDFSDVLAQRIKES